MPSQTLSPLAAIFILMRRDLIILGILHFVGLVLSFTWIYFRGQRYSGDGFVVFLIWITVLVVVPTLLGFCFWLVFSRNREKKIRHLIVFQFIAVSVVFGLNLNEGYREWHYNRFEANMDHNKRFTNRGGYVDTCMILIQDDLARRGLSLNDYRILKYSYDLSLNTIPKDTSRFYQVEVMYSINSKDSFDVRSASYFVNFDRQLKLVYDVSSNQLEEMKLSDSNSINSNRSRIMLRNFRQ